ncbi:trypsin-like peptidase domain-containing protein [Micromonospora sp. NPDC048909]|uniref:trypsin-like peptidase domain-containing protein n=1 Tax=Micromonospora sp. NPDC048909 TaxID=3155643 RepID=UPI0033DA7792
MQSVGPYRFTHLLGTCPVGKAWAAIDGQGRFVTVAVLDAAAANTPGWRESFAGTADAMSQTLGGQAFAYADFSAAEPWVAYPAEVGPGAEKLFRALGQEYQLVPTDDQGAAEPVSGVPQQVSGPPQSVSGVPQQVSAPPQSVSGAPHQVSGPPQPVSGAPQPTSGGSFAPWALHAGPLPTVQPAPTPQPAVDVPHSPAPVSAAPADPPSYDPFSAPVRRIKPSEPPRRRTGLWMGVAALVLVAAVGSGFGVWAVAGNDQADPDPLPTIAATAAPTAEPVEPGLKPWAQAALYSPEEHALAVAAPSLVFVEAVFTGYVRDAATNALVRPTPVSFIRRCSGFLVSSSGHAVTSGSCVAPDEDHARWIAVDALARLLVQEKKLPSGEVANYIRINLPKVRFTGAEPGTKPVSEVYGQLNNAKGNVSKEPAIQAEVVRALPAESGSTALIKLGQDNLPAVELNRSASLDQDASLFILGFRTTDTVFRNAVYRPQSKKVTVTGTSRLGSVSMYRISGDLGTVSHGGIALDPNGRVAGVIDQDQALPDKANRAVVPASTIGTLLDEAGVGNTLGDTDKIYRSGLDAYFGGDLSVAVTQLDKAAGAAPANLLAQAYRQNAAERERLDSAQGDGSGLVVPLLVGSGVLLVGLVIMAVLLVRRRSTIG